MTRTRAIDLVKKDLMECDSSILSEISDFDAVYTTQKEWEVTCKYKESFETPSGQVLDSVTYIVRNDETVLAIPV